MDERNGTAASAWPVRAALDEVAAPLAAVDPAQLSAAVDEVLRARRIACYAAGREGLMLRAMAMRLFHAGLDAHVVGDVTTPAIGDGDLLVLSAGPGGVATVVTYAGIARRVEARTLLFTAQPDRPPAELADTVVTIPAQTMADDIGSSAVLPMGSAYETALLVLGDLLTARVRESRGETPEDMRGRHTNLE